jgi:GH18 family chitinase
MNTRKPLPYPTRLLFRFRFVAALLILIGGTVFSQSDLWVTAYYPGYAANTLPMDSIDFNAMTHLIHFSVFPDTTGGIVHLDSTTNGIYATRSIVGKAHVYGVKVLLSVGGWDSLNGERPFQFATNPAHLAAFVSSILQYANAYGYDGIDMDWEPLTNGDSAQFTNLIGALRTQLGSGRILTVAIGNLQGLPGIVASLKSLQSQIDQINIETSDLSGAYPGWFTWHNAAIYDGGAMFAVGVSPPTASSLVTQLFNGGIALSKMSVGIDFYGYVWHADDSTLIDQTSGGPTDPRQTWQAQKEAPAVTPNVPYSTIMDSISQGPHATLVWDVDPTSLIETKASYYRIVNNTAAKDSFVSFDNQRSCIAKVQYARYPGIAAPGKLGGVMIWELSGAWRNSVSGTGTFRDSLLQSVKSEVFGNYPYKYKLQEPWQDISKSGTAVYNDASEHYLGTQSIKFSKTVSTGYFAMQYGTSTAAVLNPADFSKLEFYWYSTVTPSISTAKVNLALNGDASGFATVTLNALTPGAWALASINMSDLNPNSHTSFNQLVIKDGRTSVTYWVDDIHFFKAPSGSVAFSVNAAWNLISLPVLAANPAVTVLFPSATSAAFGYTGKYASSATMLPGTGYWLKFGGAAQNSVSGIIAGAESVQVSAGWNLIGSGSAPLVTAEISSEPAGMVTSRFFGYNNGYSATDTLMPGSGYWVHASASGTLILTSSSAPPMTRRIKIVPSSEEPPPPPAGIGNLPVVAAAVPKTYALDQNYPNPFNPTTTIHYELPVAALVKISIYNILGQEVQTLVNETEQPGYKSVQFGGENLSSGVYFYQIRAASGDGATTGSFTEVKKMVLVR